MCVRMLTHGDLKQKAFSGSGADAQQHAFSPTALAAAAAAGGAAAAFGTGAVGAAGVAGFAGGGSRADCAQAPAVPHGHIVHSCAGARTVLFFSKRLIEP
jgi:hypothetical protein